MFKDKISYKKDYLFGSCEFKTCFGLSVRSLEKNVFSTDGNLNTMELFDGTSWTLLPFNLTSERIHHCTVPLRLLGFF